MKNTFRCLFLVAISLQQASLQGVGNFGASRNRRQTGGLGCAAVLASYSQNPISNSSGLKTGTFYQFSMKYPRGGNNGGWLSWASRKDSGGANLAFTDYQNLQMYRHEGRWHHDIYWAFLTTTTPGWYHLINCAYPQKYLTWSMTATMDEPVDSNGYPLVIDERYPGTHSREDFLFKPVYVSSENSYLLMQKSFNIGYVSESSSRYSGESYWLKVVPTSKIYEGGKVSADPLLSASLFSIANPMNEIVP